MSEDQCCKSQLLPSFPVLVIDPIRCEKSIDHDGKHSGKSGDKRVEWPEMLNPDATPSSLRPAEDLVRALDRIETAVSRGLTKQEVEANFRLTAIRAALRERRELREALLEVVDTSRRLPRSVARPAGERPYDLTSASFDRAIERAAALLAQPAAGKERERG